MNLESSRVIGLSQSYYPEEAYEEICHSLSLLERFSFHVLDDIIEKISERQNSVEAYHKRIHQIKKKIDHLKDSNDNTVVLGYPCNYPSTTFAQRSMRPQSINNTDPYPQKNYTVKGEIKDDGKAREDARELHRFFTLTSKELVASDIESQVPWSELPSVGCYSLALVKRTKIKKEGYGSISDKVKGESHEDYQSEIPLPVSNPEFKFRPVKAPLPNLKVNLFPNSRLDVENSSFLPLPENHRKEEISQEEKKTQESALNTISRISTAVESPLIPSSKGMSTLVDLQRTPELKAKIPPPPPGPPPPPPFKPPVISKKLPTPPIAVTPAVDTSQSAIPPPPRPLPPPPPPPPPPSSLLPKKMVLSSRKPSSTAQEVKKAEPEFDMSALLESIRNPSIVLKKVNLDSPKIGPRITPPKKSGKDVIEVEIPSPTNQNKLSHHKVRGEKSEQLSSSAVENTADRVEFLKSAVGKVRKAIGEDEGSDDSDWNED